jgi:hypothetical protein
VGRMDWDRVRAENRLWVFDDYSARMDRHETAVIGGPDDRRDRPAGSKRPPPSMSTRDVQMRRWARTWAKAHKASDDQEARFFAELRRSNDLRSYSAKDVSPFLQRAATVNQLIAIAKPFREQRLAERAKRRKLKPAAQGGGGRSKARRSSR